jgi:hypothetical protein
MCGRESILQESQQSCICVLENRFCRKVSSHVFVCQGIDFAGN